MRLARRDQRSLLSVSRPHAGPISLSAVVDALQNDRARHVRQLGTATCAALPSKARLRAAALRSPLRYTLRSVPPFRSCSPTLRPKRLEPFSMTALNRSRPKEVIQEWTS